MNIENDNISILPKKQLYDMVSEGMATDHSAAVICSFYGTDIKKLSSMSVLCLPFDDIIEEIMFMAFKREMAARIRTRKRQIDEKLTVEIIPASILPTLEHIRGLKDE